MVAAEFEQQVAANGVVVDVHDIREVTPTDVAPADLYVFSSPGRFGKPIGRMRRFLKTVKLPAGTSYAILTTEAAPKPDKKTGRMPTEQELAKVAEDKIFVTGLKGPLDEGWQTKVEVFANQIAPSAGTRGSAATYGVEAE